MQETRLVKLFQILRFCGAAMIVAAAGTFLVQQWHEAGHIARYLTLLGVTVLLPVLGYLCGIRLQEGRSARVLMLTLLALLPIHAGVLGGLVYSQFGAESSVVTGAAQWIADSKVQVFIVLAGATAVLAPLTWAAFRTLCRSRTNLLTMASAALHALVLIPNRTGGWAAFAVVTAFGGAMWAVVRIKPQTREARLAGASLLLPGLLLIARQLAFYEVTQVFFGMIAALGAWCVFALGRQLGDPTLERFAVSPLIVSAALFAPSIQSLFRLDDANVVMLVGTLLAVAMLGFGWWSHRSRSFFVYGAVLLNVALSLVTSILHGGAWPALESMVLGLGILSYGFITQRKVETYAGAAIAASGFLFEIALAIDEFGWGGWIALAAFGLALVALTAWLERRARIAHAGTRDSHGLQRRASLVQNVK